MTTSAPARSKVQDFLERRERWWFGAAAPAGAASATTAGPALTAGATAPRGSHAARGWASSPTCRTTSACGARAPAPTGTSAAGSSASRTRLGCAAGAAGEHTSGVLTARRQATAGALTASRASSRESAAGRRAGSILGTGLIFVRAACECRYENEGSRGTARKLKSHDSRRLWVWKGTLRYVWEAESIAFASVGSNGKAARAPHTSRSIAAVSSNGSVQGERPFEAISFRGSRIARLLCARTLRVTATESRTKRWRERRRHRRAAQRRWWPMLGRCRRRRPSRPLRPGWRSGGAARTGVPS